MASPLAGLAAGSRLRALVARLDRALCARPELAALPGRFLFALDDGRGDVAAADPDLRWQAVAATTAGCSSRAQPVARVLPAAAG